MAFDISAFGVSRERLPCGWVARRIDALALFNPEQINSGYSHSHIAYLDISNVGWGAVSQPTLLPLSDAPSRAKRIVRSHDVILSTVRPGNRAYAFIKEAPDNLIVSTGFAVLRAKQGTADARFVYYLTTSDPIIHYLASIAEEKTAYPSVNPIDIGDCIVPVPPLPEQCAIAHILGTLDDKIELNRRMNDTLEAMARALFKSWFVDFDPVIDNALAAGNPIPGALAEKAARRRALSDKRQPLPELIRRLFPDRFVDSELGPIPEGWGVGNMGDHFCITMGQSPPGSTYNEGGIGLPFYQGRVDFTFRFPVRRVFCTAPTRFAETGDTLVTVRAPVGDANMAMERCSIGRGVAAVRHATGSRSYTYYFVRSLQPVFERFEAEGTVFGAINKEGFSCISCVVPPSELVQRFDALCSPIDERIKPNELESRTLATLGDTLLPKLISGELRVKDAERFIVGAAL